MRTRKNTSISSIKQVQWNLYKTESHGTQNIFCLRQVFGLQRTCLRQNYCFLDNTVSCIGILNSSWSDEYKLLINQVGDQHGNLENWIISYWSFCRKCKYPVSSERVNTEFYQQMCFSYAPLSYRNYCNLYDYPCQVHEFMYLGLKKIYTQASTEENLTIFCFQGMNLWITRNYKLKNKNLFKILFYTSRNYHFLFLFLR